MKLGYRQIWAIRTILIGPVAVLVVVLEGLAAFLRDCIEWVSGKLPQV